MDPQYHFITGLKKNTSWLLHKVLQQAGLSRLAQRLLKKRTEHFKHFKVQTNSMSVLSGTQVPSLPLLTSSPHRHSRLGASQSAAMSSACAHISHASAQPPSPICDPWCTAAAEGAIHCAVLSRVYGAAADCQTRTFPLEVLGQSLLLLCRETLSHPPATRVPLAVVGWVPCVANGQKS